MPFSRAFDDTDVVVRVRRLRRNPWASYGLAFAIVAAATGARWLVDDYLAGTVPFITFYPAILIAALVGGFWPGILSIFLSTLAAWYFFLPSAMSWKFDADVAFTIVFFEVIAFANAAVVLFLDRALNRVVAQENNVRVLIESAPNGIVVVDEQGQIKLVNASTERLFGYPPGELVGQRVDVLVPEPQVATHRKVRSDYQKAPEARAMGAGRDLSGRRKDGSEFSVEIGLSPVAANGNRAVLATVIDISARKRVAEHQALLIRELQHRTKNLFAVVQSIANNTLLAGRPIVEARYVFNNRLQALARAYELIAETDPGQEGASLAQILDRQFAGFAHRVSASGCDLVVSVSAAQQFALVVHELATNALKYGALSNAEGRVTIAGAVERVNGDGLFSFLWQESGGPPVSEPTSRGFGSVILVDAAGLSGNRADMRFEPAGLRYELRLPLSEITLSPKPVAIAVPYTDGPSTLAG